MTKRILPLLVIIGFLALYAVVGTMEFNSLYVK